jgi:TonB family protein
MASRAQITEILPETLPADFVEWDVVSPSTQSVQSISSEPGSGIGVVSKPATQAPQAHPAGVAPGNMPHGAALSVSALENKGGASALHRAQSLNAALLSSRDIRLQEAVPAIHEPRFSAPPVNGTRAATTTAEFHDLLYQSLPANAVERTRPSKKKWPIVDGASAALLLILGAAIIIPAFNRDRVTSVKPADPPAPTMATIQQPEDAVPTHARSKLRVPASTAAATTAREAQINSEARRPVHKNARPSQDQAQMMHDQLHTPARLQMKPTSAEQTPLSPGGFAASDVAGLDNDNAIGAVFASPRQPKVQIASQQTLKVTPGVALALLTQKTLPIYPSIAKSVRVSGTVVLTATISKTGRVENLSVVSGPLMLRSSAVDAVRTWRFKPYMLDKQPTAIETTINLNFSLN